MIDLPRPISVNKLWYNRRRDGGRSRTKEYCAWLRAAGWMVKAAHVKQFAGEVSIVITIPNDYRGDADNTIKAVLDCMQACGVVRNDRQFRKITVQFGPVEGMRAEIAPLEMREAA